MTARPPAAALTAEEAVARFEAAPVPSEVVVETVARALCAAAHDFWTPANGRYYRRLAAAAIAALPPSPAEEALRRLVDVLDGITVGRKPAALESAIATGRAALASPAPAPQTCLHGGPPDRCADPSAPASIYPDGPPSCACGGPCEHDGSLAAARRFDRAFAAELRAGSAPRVAGMCARCGGDGWTGPDDPRPGVTCDDCNGTGTR